MGQICSCSKIENPSNLCCLSYYKGAGYLRGNLDESRMPDCE